MLCWQSCLEGPRGSAANSESPSHVLPAGPLPPNLIDYADVPDVTNTWPSGWKTQVRYSMRRRKGQNGNREGRKGQKETSGATEPGGAIHFQQGPLGKPRGKGRDRGTRRGTRPQGLASGDHFGWYLEGKGKAMDGGEEGKERAGSRLF